MNVLTSVLDSQKIDQTPTAYLLSTIDIYCSNGKKPDPEVLAYCFAALLSMVSIGVIQNQRDRIFDIIRTQLLTPSASTHTAKYGVIAL